MARTSGANRLSPNQINSAMIFEQGFDEVIFAEHLQEGDQATADKWDALGDLKDSDGDFQFTVTDDQDRDLALAMSADRPAAIGEILEGLSASELITTTDDRDFTGTPNWTNAAGGDALNAYNETGDLTITADAIGQWAYLDVANAQMTAGLRYRLQFDVANITETWDIKDFTGAQTFGTVSLDGKEQFIEFVVDAGLSGGFRIVSKHATSSADFDNFTLKQIIHLGHTFQVTGSGDTIGNDLQAAKSGAPADNDTFVVTGITTQVMPFLADRDFSAVTAWADVDLNAFNESNDLTITATSTGQYCTLAVASAPMTAGVVYRLYYDLANIVSTWSLKDFTGTDTHGTISGNITQGYIEFTAVTGGGFRLVALANNSSGDFDNFSLRAATATVASMGNLVAVYAFNKDQTSTFIQTFANRTVVGLNSKEFAFTYVITSPVDPDGLTLTLETFPASSVTMPYTAGTHTVFFQSATDAGTVSFVITAVTSGGTKGALSIDTLSLVRCCDAGSNPDTNAWIMIRPLEADATVSATAIAGDDLSSTTLAVLESNSELRGNWSRILVTAGKIAAYRV